MTHRKLRFGLGGAAASFVLVAGTVLGAGPAFAADANVDCGTSATFSSPTINSGSSFTILNAGSVSCNVSQSGGTPGVVTWTDGTTSGTSTLASGATLTVTGASGGLATLLITTSARSFDSYFNFFVLSGGGGGGGGGSSSSSSSSGSTGPTPIFQQFGLPASGTCDEAAPADLDWAGVPSGGWGISWAQWMNDGNGGAVCTRTVSYVGTGWTIN